ncbi:MAG: T9SS C-terminal target domain-containing protein [Cytophagales bacterium]|nr:MAG: T9SS C-terminal target domain-containing protein [Cytophagales bacterium]
MKISIIHLTTIKTVLLITICSTFNLYSQILPPAQPILGPGGKTAEIHLGFDSAFYGDKIENQFWLFEPKTPKPSNAPVVFFWHGTYTGKARELGAVLASDLFEYVKRGYIVVAPLYQHGSYEPTASKKIELFGSITKAALAELEKPGHITPQKNKEGLINYGCVGYSLGGMIFAGANNYQKLGIHAPLALVGVLPFGHQEHTPYSNIPTSTKVALISSDSDMDFLKVQADNMHWPGLAHIPCKNKVYVYAQSGNGLTADHLFPLRIAINSLDYFVAWKYTFGMMDCALQNKNCEYVLTNRDSITFTGLFSNQKPAKPLIIKDGACDAVTSLIKNNNAIVNNEISYQNPVNKQLSIHYRSKGSYEAKIIDMNGLLRLSEMSADQTQNINTSNLKPGIYLLEITNDNEIIKRDKIIIE